MPKTDVRLRVLFLFILSMMDMVLTLVMVGRGAKEINPFMAWVLEQGDVHFIWVKVLLSAAGCLGLAWWHRVRAASVMTNITLVVYGLVVSWSLFLLV